MNTLDYDSMTDEEFVAALKLDEKEWALLDSIESVILFRPHLTVASSFCSPGKSTPSLERQTLLAKSQKVRSKKRRYHS